MGKNNGFLLYQRRENGIEDPLRRIKNYQEFHQPLTKEQRRLQGARCTISFRNGMMKSTAAILPMLWPD